MKATTYNYRCYSTGNKLVGGSIPRDTTLEQAAEYVTKGLQVKALGPDRCVYVYNGKPVYVYLTLDPHQSVKGKAAMKEYIDRMEKAEEAQRKLENELDSLVRKVGVENAIKTLKSVGETLNDS